MKILLVKPKPRLKTVLRVQPIVLMEPLELGYIAAAVPPGHDVRIMDLRLSGRPDRDFVNVLESYRPDIVGLSGYTHEATKVKEMARTVRRMRPHARIVVGGPHATVIPQDYNLECFDAIVRGEGCAPFRAIVEAAGNGGDFAAIENVMVPGPGFSAEAAERMPRFPDLDTLPAPRRDLWDAHRYQCIWPAENHRAGESIFPEVALVRTSFGCLMNCTFCLVPALSGRRHLTRQPEKVAEEIATLEQECIYFCDDETFLNENHARRVAEAIRERGIQKRYFAWARSTTVNRRPELFRLWRDIGLDAVFLGFEAILDSDLEQLSKRSTVADNERALATLREMGIAVHAGFMVRADFSHADFRNLREYVQRMPPAQITCTVYTPSPGSAAWYEERKRYICHPFDLHDAMHPLTPTTIPLPEFFAELANLSTIAASHNPLRPHMPKCRPRDILRIVVAAKSYTRTLRRAWRDY